MALAFIRGTVAKMRFAIALFPEHVTECGFIRFSEKIERDISAPCTSRLRCLCAVRREDGGRRHNANGRHGAVLRRAAGSYETTMDGQRRAGMLRT